ncbi:FAD-binding domain-containing protein 5 [Elsinoe fawcettii]|nr:FAD-binding domain-containing protein 5 [Elsinoe fawcettii]
MPHRNLPIVWRESADPHDYEAQRRRVFNLRVPDRFPDAIVRPTSVADIVAAVQIATEKSLRIAIRSGGHSWACWSIRDDSLLVDLVDFKHIHYNEETDTLEASPATMGSELASFLAAKKRWFPSGHCPTVALGGFLLQGGMGLNARGYGWSASYIKGIDVVTSEGRVLYCDASQNADLLWAAQGAGPGFPGIITRFYLRTLPDFPVHKIATYAWPIAKFDETMDWIIKILPELDRNIEPVIHIANDADKGYNILMVFVGRGSVEHEVNNSMAVLASAPSGSVVPYGIRSSSTMDDYGLTDHFMPPQRRWVADTVYLHNEVNMKEYCREIFTSLPVDGIAFWEPMSPISREPLKDMALSLHSDNYVALYAAYHHSADDTKYEKWISEAMDVLKSEHVGAYMGDKDFQRHTTQFWDEVAGRRLMMVRETWDPAGRICGYLVRADASGTGGLDNKLQ